MKDKIVKYAGLIIAIIALAAIIFNAGTLHNDVRHLRADIEEVKQEVKFISQYLLEKK